MKKKNNTIMVGVVVTLLVTLILLGLTYAYYKTRVVGNSNEKSVSVDTKKLEVTYTDGDATLSASGNIEPGFKFTKEFTVANTGSESVNYSIILDNIENTYTRDQDWEYTLKKGDSEISTGTIAVGTHQVLIGSETLASGSQTYKLEVEYVNSEEDQSEDMGETMSFRVNISDETQTWDNATSGTLLYAIKTNQPSGTGETTPGQQASLETEARILSTQDDYGTSYVYRGNVTNNYVNYSGMCWRVVRVQGDGTIKLALADENGECNADTYSTSNITSASINNQKGYAYKNSMSLDNTDFIYKDSNIPAILNNWATKEVERNGQKVTNLDISRLVETEWCQDTTKKRVLTNGTIYYGAQERLGEPTTAQPTLKCNTEGMEGTTGIEANAQKYVGKIALLTADEVVFAGATAYLKDTEYSHYLKTNASNVWYWTMSLGNLDYTNSKSYMWLVYASGRIGTAALNTSSPIIRPSIVLTSNVTISSTTQDGTQSNPYVIS